jgi:nucleotide sugar dehydrogenase
MMTNATVDEAYDHLPTVTVVGLGKIGLPLAVQYARRGLQVIGVDIDREVVDEVRRGCAPFPGETGLEAYLSEVVAAGKLTATTDTSGSVAQSNVVVVVVPLVVGIDGQPDFGALDAATEAVANGMQPGTLVLYETTVPVHTTRGRFAPALEKLTGMTCGVEFSVAFSPERVYSGRIFEDLRRYPKLIGGLDHAAAAAARRFYELALEFDARDDLPEPNGVWDLGSAEAAELAKLAETTYRDINIAFANELAIFSESAGIDVFSVIRAANSQPFSHIHLPGIAVGGHCIPVYPRLFLSNAPDALVPAAARASNEMMPAHAVRRLEAELGSLDALRVVVLGATYRGGVKETAFSGVFPLVAELTARGARATVHDPLLDDNEIKRLGLDPHHLGEPCDAVILQADHAMYRHLTVKDLPGVRVLVDGRRVTNPSVWTADGVIHLQLGCGTPASH